MRLCFGMDATFIQARIDYFEALILVYETALSSLASGAKSYTINTGQTTQSVTKRDTVRVEETLAWAYQMLEYWEMRLNGGVTTYVGRG